MALCAAWDGHRTAWGADTPAAARRLRAAGMTIENLIKITTIVPNEADIPAVRSGREAVLGSHKPASTLIVAGLANPALKIEVEGIAVA